MLTVTKSFEFAYAHKLPDYNGLCKNLHGHNGRLLITVSASSDSSVYNGMIMDFKDLKKIVNELVISKLDHAYLNDFIKIPTAENMTLWIVEKLKSAFGAALECVRVYETEDSYAEWTK